MDRMEGLYILFIELFSYSFPEKGTKEKILQLVNFIIYAFIWSGK